MSVAFAAAPTIIINSPNGGELITANNGDYNIDFNVTTVGCQPTADFYYDDDGVYGASNNIELDVNLMTAGICADTNFDDSTNCIYSWDSSPIVGGHYYPIIEIDTSACGNNWDASAGTVTVDNNAPIITNLYPENNGWVNNSLEQVMFTVLEMESDVNVFSLILQVDGNTYSISDSQVDYNSVIQTFTFTPDYNYLEGATINVIVDVDDNAGNSATQASWLFKTDYTDPGASIDDDSISISWVQSDLILVACNDLGGAPCESSKLYYFSETGGVCSSTKADYVNSTLTNTITVSSDENKFLCLWVEDEAGNSDVDFSNPTKPLRVDTIIPITTHTYAGGWIANTDVNFICTDLEIFDVNVSGCANFQHNGIVETNDSNAEPFIFDFSSELSEGINTVSYKSCDRAGNCEGLTSIDVNVDTVAPINPDINIATYTSDDKPDLDLYAYDATSGVKEMAFSCNDTNYTSWITYATSYSDFNITDSAYGCNTTQGDKNVFVMFRDQADNESTSVYATTVYDTNAPIASINPSAPAGWVNTDYTITLACSDAESGPANLLYWIDAVGYSQAVTDYNIVFNTDGNHEFIYTCEDNAGGRDANVTVYVAIDKTDPSTSITPSGWQNTDLNVVLTCIDTNSGCASTTYRLDTNSEDGVSYGGWLVYTVPLTISIDGNYAIDFNSTDGAGNVEVTNTAYLLLDKTVPVINIGATSTSVSTNDVTFSFSADDNVSGIAGYWVRVGSDPWVYTTNTSHVFNDLSNGDYNFYVIATNNSDLNSVQDDANATVNYSPPPAPTGSGGSGGSNGPIIGLPSSTDNNVSTTDETPPADGTSTTDGGDTTNAADGSTEDTLTIVDANIFDEPAPPTGTGFFGLETIGPIGWLAIVALGTLAFVAVTNKRVRGMFTGKE